MLVSVASECSLVHASLAHLQNQILADHGALHPLLTLQVITMFDIALLGCALTFSVLDEGVKRFVEVAAPSHGLSRKAKMHFAIDHDQLKEFLTPVRGQQVAITLLLTTIQR